MCVRVRACVHANAVGVPPVASRCWLFLLLSSACFYSIAEKPFRVLHHLRWSFNWTSRVQCFEFFSRQATKKKASQLCSIGHFHRRKCSNAITGTWNLSILIEFLSEFWMKRETNTQNAPQHAVGDEVKRKREKRNRNREIPVPKQKKKKKQQTRIDRYWFPCCWQVSNVPDRVGAYNCRTKRWPFAHCAIKIIGHLISFARLSSRATLGLSPYLLHHFSLFGEKQTHTRR